MERCGFVRHIAAPESALSIGCGLKIPLIPIIITFKQSERPLFIMASNYNDKRRDLKRPYRKKAFQTGYNQAGDANVATPLPFHSYTTDLHTATQPARPGIDARTYMRAERPSVESLDSLKPLDQASYPWHTVPLGDAANVIQRQKWTFDGSSGNPANLTAGTWCDFLVINVSADEGTSATGSNEWTSGIPNIVSDSVRSKYTPPQLPSINVNAPQRGPGESAATASGDGSVGNLNPVGGEISAGALSGTRTLGMNVGQYFQISRFGHTEPDGASDPLSSIEYMIFLDGNLFMSWTGFQWSPVSPFPYMWQFLQPLNIERQLVMRVSNPTGSGAAVTGSMESCFVGWTEQMNGFFDIMHDQLQS